MMVIIVQQFMYLTLHGNLTKTRLWLYGIPLNILAPKFITARLHSKTYVLLAAGCIVLAICTGFDGFSSGDILVAVTAVDGPGAEGGGAAVRTDFDERLILSSSMLRSLSLS
jgi:hypothetical protein